MVHSNWKVKFCKNQQQWNAILKGMEWNPYNLWTEVKINKKPFADIHYSDSNRLWVDCTPNLWMVKTNPSLAPGWMKLVAGTLQIGVKDLCKTLQSFKWLKFWLLTNLAVQCLAVVASGLKTRSCVSSSVDFSLPETVSELALTYRLCPTTDCSACRGCALDVARRCDELLLASCGLWYDQPWLDSEDLFIFLASRSRLQLLHGAQRASFILASVWNTLGKPSHDLRKFNGWFPRGCPFTFIHG